MRPSKANVALLKARISHKQIAQEVGVSLEIVSKAVKEGRSCIIGSRIWRVRVAICEATGAGMGELWPLKEKEPAASPTSK